MRPPRAFSRLGKTAWQSVDAVSSSGLVAEIAKRVFGRPMSSPDFALGTAAGYFAHERDNPFILSVLPGGVAVGVKKRF
jgi:hypothetical protein